MNNYKVNQLKKLKSDYQQYIDNQMKHVKALMTEINDLCKHIQYIDTLIIKEEKEDGVGD